MSSRPAMAFAPAGSVRLEGLLGDALEANRAGRLSHFIVDENSAPIALFAPDAVASNEDGDWYGEHAGKWLFAASRAAVRAGDPGLLDRVRRVADWLIDRQDEDGYIGNYAPARRFTVKQPPKPFSWDGAPALRTWDIWTHSYLILGLIELHRATGEARYLDAACRIGDLAWATLGAGEIRITELGNHFGLSATILLDPAVELYLATGRRDYLDLALLIVQQSESDPKSAFLSAALNGADPSEIATGKAYQLLWNMVGLAKLHLATGDPRYLEAVHSIWRSVRDHHLTLGGGPWGGIAHRSREVFNPAAAFDPHGYVETCSSMAWLQLNRTLLTILGDACFAEEIERTAYNDLLGAQAPDGEDWCYYSFPNGRRVHTTYWRCCKSSGAMALEELAGVAFALLPGNRIAVNLLGPSIATIALPGIGDVRIRQQGRYPFDGAIEVSVEADGTFEFTVEIRIPAWAEGATLQVGTDERPVTAGTYAAICREWAPGDRFILKLPMRPAIVRRSSRNVQESLAPGGVAVAQEVMRFDYVALTRGPLVYATGLIDGYRTGETLAAEPRLSQIREIAPEAGQEGPQLELMTDGRPAILFEPYYRAGGRKDGSWRLTWLGVAPADALG